MKRDFTGSPKSPIGFLGKRKHNGAVSFSVRKTISGVCADEGVAVKIAGRSKPTSDFGNRKRTLFLQERTPRGERYNITPSWKQGGVFFCGYGNGCLIAQETFRATSRFRRNVGGEFCSAARWAAYWLPFFSAVVTFIVLQPWLVCCAFVSFRGGDFHVLQPCAGGTYFCRLWQK